ncbi:hypothetical protein K2173_009928 [Erythroxylum novogranatense]|uniref:60S ribosomal protein L35 n=1 Tax=Erythroxylum novogranatense TaxID=1862640 RepID=A0AAV8SZJ3_9ROSI|nr:hypothetical protein K2173_009928 [Erythroxylum novogranatense]
MEMARLKVHELRNKSKTELLSQLKELKSELALLCLAKVTGGAPNKLSKIKKQKAVLRGVYKNKKFLPLDLCPKKTHASLKTKKKKHEMYFPMRKYAIKV